MAFVSGGGSGGGGGTGIGGIGSGLPTDAQAISPRSAASLNAAALAAAQVSATPIPAAHLLYQQFLSAGAVAAQSQLLQGTAAAAAVSQTAPSLPPPTQILPQAAQTASAPQSQQQQQQQNQAFVLANAAQALAINQLLLQQNPLQQQVQAALAQLLNPFAYYQPHLAALLQQSQLTATNHVQQPQQPPQIQVQNGIGTPVAAQQQQKLIENLLAEQVIRNPTTHDKIDISQPVVADNRNVGLLTSAESVKEHISRLISENEAILEQNPGLIKRRPYHRQVGSQSSIELETGIRSQSNSPGLRDVRLQFTHGQSFYESHKPLALRVTGGPLTNGHPIVKALDKCTCNYCELKFPNDAALVAHEIRCSKRAEVHSQIASSSTSSSTAAAAAHLQIVRQQNSANTGTVDRIGRKSNICDNSSIVSSPVLHENRHPLKRRLLAAAEHLDEPQASTSKTAKLEISKSNVNVTNPVCISLPATHHKTPIIPQRSFNSANNISTASEASVPAAQTVIIVTSQPTSQLVASKNAQAYQQIYPSSTVPHSTVDSEEAKLNLLYISTCSTKPRMGVKQLWRYTTALREMGVLKVTHSSFWDYSTKMRLRQNAAATATTVAPINSQAVIATFVQERSSTIASTSATVSATNVTNFLPPNNPPNRKTDSDANINGKENMIVVEKNRNASISLKEYIFRIS
ncbi:hypothetical protein X798_08087 [Onchocerca flexuosa]|uniref:Uncharacterized protein n=1 Tax=Onchocerca flexuosa TaxID=387005 RepID=A0A238BK44_9BILA|nr:hypothetical protein X798_08087 [Onchocerca flexuosa]